MDHPAIQQIVGPVRAKWGMEMGKAMKVGEITTQSVAQEEEDLEEKT